MCIIVCPCFLVCEAIFASNLLISREILNAGTRLTAHMVLPPMDKREATRKVAEYTKLSEGVVRNHLNAVYATIRDMDEFDNLKEAA